RNCGGVGVVPSSCHQHVLCEGGNVGDPLFDCGQEKPRGVAPLRQGRLQAVREAQQGLGAAPVRCAWPGRVRGKSAGGGCGER
ncbi:unnamed protein product, partial [Ectocarpus sp. 4 AP-2014]